MAGHTLVCPFLNDSQDYALGVEFGMFWALISGSDKDVIEDFFTRANQDQILLGAQRAGWRVVEIKNENKDWFWCRLEKPCSTDVTC